MQLSRLLKSKNLGNPQCIGQSLSNYLATSDKLKKKLSGLLAALVSTSGFWSIAYGH